MEDWAIKVKNRADKAGIVIWSVHLPFGGPYDISQTNDTLRQRAVELNMNDMILSAKIVAPEKFVIHPSAEPISNEERATRIVASKKSLQELAAKAKELNIPLLVENLPRTCLGNTSTELLEIINGIDNTAICFDVNHLLIEPQVCLLYTSSGYVWCIYGRRIAKVQRRLRSLRIPEHQLDQRSPAAQSMATTTQPDSQRWKFEREIFRRIRFCKSGRPIWRYTY